MTERYKPELDKIDDIHMRRLLDKTRTQVIEMGKPLIRSADKPEIGEASRVKPFGSLTRRSVETLSGNAVDAIPTMLQGTIVRFDKENGWGKFRSPDFPSPISFVVPAVKRDRLRDDVIDAMKEDKIDIIFYHVRDKGGKAVYLIFDNILDEATNP